ncbi:hypothetical protein WN943_023270 [Citrus x changshan-huyou]
MLISAGVDERLDVNFDEQQTDCSMIVGLWCAHPDRNCRPSIRQAIQVLNFETKMPNLPSKMPVAIFEAPASSGNGTTQGLFARVVAELESELSDRLAYGLIGSLTGALKLKVRLGKNLELASKIAEVVGEEGEQGLIQFDKKKKKPTAAGWKQRRADAIGAREFEIAAARRKKNQEDARRNSIEEKRQPFELISMIGFVNSLIPNSIMLG